MSDTIFKIPKFKVFHCIPWNSEKTIGKSYNQFMNLIGSNDWCCFLDGDAVHTNPFLGKGLRILLRVILNIHYLLVTQIELVVRIKLLQTLIKFQMTKIIIETLARIYGKSLGLMF